MSQNGAVGRLRRPRPSTSLRRRHCFVFIARCFESETGLQGAGVKIDDPIPVKIHLSTVSASATGVIWTWSREGDTIPRGRRDSSKINPNRLAVSTTTTHCLMKGFPVAVDRHTRRVPKLLHEI